MLRKYRTARRDRVVLLYIKYTTKANIAAGGSRLRRGHIDQNSYRTYNNKLLTWKGSTQSRERNMVVESGSPGSCKGI